MEPFWMIGFMMGVVGWIFTPQYFRVDKEFLKQAVMFLIGLMAVKLAIAFMAKINPIPFLQMIPAKNLFMVWWEDMAFTLPLLWINSLEGESPSLTRKILCRVPMLFIALTFGMGHAYQGELAILLTTFTMLFVFFRFSKKHGILSMAILHLFYDMSVYVAMFILSMLVK